MPFSMSQASLPVFEISLNALSAILDRAQAYAAAKKIDSSVLLNSRLSPDMFALARQVQIAADQAKNGSARLAGVEAPRYEDNETTMDQLKARLEKTVAYLKTLDPKRIDASANREITFPLGPTNKGHMKGDDYLNHFVLPNFYFHITAAYAILRHCGVDIGKRDFLGAIPIDRPSEARQLLTWISHRDMVQLVRRCIDHPHYHFVVVYGVSNNLRGRWDNINAQFLGYLPEDDSEAFAAELFHGAHYCSMEFNGNVDEID